MIRYLVIAFLILQTIVLSQEWYKGNATLVGGETETIAQLRQRTLQAARVDALRDAGISIQSMEVRLQGESKNNVIDMYGSFAQSNSRGIIVKERNVKEKNTFTTIGGISLPQIEISLEALVDMPKGEVDRTFEAVISTDKKTYYEGENLHVTVQSTKNGFLSLFEIKNDTCFILHPHPFLPVTYDNMISANNKIIIPPRSEPYSFELDLEGGDGNQSVEFIVAVVTKENIPIGGNFNRKEFFSLQEYNSWLVSIPVDQRSSASAIISIVKK